jgi:aspartyl-tRNA(Asn)/glutamyl-tRNA(Gln) amidotransferase subunit C
MIDKEHVRYIAALSHLSLSDAETEAFAGQLDSVLEYVEQLNKVDTSNVEPMAFLASARDPMRADVETPSLSLEKLLQNGPKVTNGYFAVPKVIAQ